MVSNASLSTEEVPCKVTPSDGSPGIDIHSQQLSNLKTLFSRLNLLWLVEVCMQRLHRRMLAKIFDRNPGLASSLHCSADEDRSHPKSHHRRPKSENIIFKISPELISYQLLVYYKMLVNGKSVHTISPVPCDIS